MKSEVKSYHKSTAIKERMSTFRGEIFSTGGREDTLILNSYWHRAETYRCYSSAVGDLPLDAHMAELVEGAVSLPCIYLW
jgi:hypothetical protein